MVLSHYHQGEDPFTMTVGVESGLGWPCAPTHQRCLVAVEIRAPISLWKTHLLMLLPQRSCPRIYSASRFFQMHQNMPMLVWSTFVWLTQMETSISLLSLLKWSSHQTSDHSSFRALWCPPTRSTSKPCQRSLSSFTQRYGPNNQIFLLLNHLIKKGTFAYWLPFNQRHPSFPWIGIQALLNWNACLTAWLFRFINNCRAPNRNQVKAIQGCPCLSVQGLVTA